MKPICVKCQQFYRVQTTGFVFIEGMPTAHEPGTARALPGNATPEKWQDYKLWSGDFWKCQGCGHELISGVGQCPISEHYRDDFQGWKERLGASFRVNDC